MSRAWMVLISGLTGLTGSAAHAADGKSKLRSLIKTVGTVNRLTPTTTLRWVVTTETGPQPAGVNVGAYKFKPDNGAFADVAIATLRDGAPNTVKLQLLSSTTKVSNPECTMQVRQASSSDGSFSEYRNVAIAETTPLTLRGSQTAVNITVSLPAILTALGVGPNRALVGATVTCQGPPVRSGVTREGPVSTTAEGLLHIVRRRYVLVLPGVFGSSIDVNPQGGIALANWPWGALKSGDNITPLQCNAHGVPVNPANKIRVVTQAYKSAPTYEGMEEGVPWIQSTTVKSEKGRFWHHPVSYIPYDWRRKSVRVIEDLLRDDEALSRPDEQALAAQSFPELTRTPSLRAIKRVFLALDPMMDDKFAIIGHSTGGLLVNGLARTTRQTLNGQNVAVATNLPPAGDTEHGPWPLVNPTDYVASAFTAAAPLAGATSALRGYFDADMGWSGLKDTAFKLAQSYQAFQEISSTLPIIYALSPTNQGRTTENGANPIASIKLANGTINSYNSLLQFFDALKTAIGNNPVQRTHQIARQWNNARLAESEAFHGFCRNQNAAIPVTAFFTVVSDSQSTVSGLTFDVANGTVSYNNGDGDETVPRASLSLTQQGVTGVLLRMNKKHGPMVNERDLWKEVAARLDAP